MYRNSYNENTEGWNTSLQTKSVFDIGSVEVEQNMYADIRVMITICWQTLELKDSNITILIHRIIS